MNHREQIDAFSNDLFNLIDRYRSEFELPLASVVGTLELASHHLLREAIDNAEDDDDE